MKESAKMVFDDPSKFHLLATQLKVDLTKAVVNAVNIMAALGRKEAVKNIQSKFINRNTFTARQVQFTPMSESKYVKLDAIQATLGATDKAPYMARQEEGGKHTPSKGKTLAIPTDYARGGNKRRMVAAAMRLGKIGKRRRVQRAAPRWKSQKAAKVACAYIAFKRGLFLSIGDTKKRRNLFLVTAFHKTKKGVAFQLKQVYRFDKEETTTKAEPWLLPASEKVARQVQAIFNAQMKKIGL